MMKQYRNCLKHIALMGTFVGIVGGCIWNRAFAVEVPLSAVNTPDTVQIYGEDAKANQLGKGYVVFQQRGTKVVGALYYPQSEYSCFIGSRTSTQLNITAFDTALSPSEAIAIPLNTLHSVGQVGEAERVTLSACLKEAAPVQRNGFAIAEQ
jgi:hypothetical protein